MVKKMFKRVLHGPSEDTAAPLGGSRAQSIQRLQIGISGIVLMILLVAFADLIQDRAAETEATSVPEAAATVAAEDVEAPQSDPLADAGVVPNLPAEPTPAPEPDPELLEPQEQASEAE